MKGHRLHLHENSAVKGETGQGCADVRPGKVNTGSVQKLAQKTKPILKWMWTPMPSRCVSCRYKSARKSAVCAELEVINNIIRDGWIIRNSIPWVPLLRGNLEAQARPSRALPP